MKFVIIDFEATCLENELIDKQEIIEFPSVVMDENGTIESTFRAYVKPEHNPQLSEFCTRLTGITQQDVDNAQPFVRVLEDHTRWLTEQGLFEKHGLFQVVTMGDWDFMNIFPHQCDLCNITVPPHFRRWVNLKHVLLTHFVGFPKHISLHHVVTKYFKLEWIGRMHSGLDDSHNIAMILYELIHIYGIRIRCTSRLSYAGRKYWKRVEEHKFFSTTKEEECEINDETK